MKKRAELTRLLDFMEDNIDPDHIREIEQLQYDAISFTEIERLPLTICTMPEGFTKMPLEEALEDPEKMLFNEILSSAGYSAYNSVRIKDDGPLMIRADFGTGIIASMFGCKSFVNQKMQQTVVPITKEEAKRAFAKGVPDVKNALGKKVIETYQYYHERLRAYPKCYDAIRITQPDMPSPFDILRLILGSDTLCEDIQLMEEWISTAARTFIQFRREIEPLLTDRFYDAIFACGVCCGGKVLIKTLASPASLTSEKSDFYETQPNMFILNVFSQQGGGSLHYSGEPKPWLSQAFDSEGLRSIHFEDPALNPLDKIYSQLKAKNISIVGFGQSLDYDHVQEAVLTANMSKPATTGLTLACKAENWQQGVEILDRHKKQSRINRL